MSLLSKLKDLIVPSSGMICQRCEKPLEGHDEKDCERRMSRRYFFGVVAGAVATAVGASLISPELKKFVVTDVVPSGIAIARGNSFLTAREISNEMLRVLQMKMAEANEFERQWMMALGAEAKFLKRGDIIEFAGVYK